MALLVPFAVDPEALTPTEDGAALLSAHLRVIKFWEEHGVLVFDGKDLAHSGLWDTIEALPHRLRVRWKTAFKNLRKMPGPENWPGLEYTSSFADLEDLKEVIRLACVDTVRGVLLGIPDMEASLMIDGLEIEVCRFDCIGDALLVTKATKIAKAAVDKDRKHSAVWSERFGLIAELARNVSIVDRYALERQMARYGGAGGIKPFLTRLDGTSRGCRVSIYTSRRELDRADVERELFSIVRGLSRGGVKEVTVHLVDDWKFGGVEHGRFLRFDNTVLFVDKGLELFEGKFTCRSRFYAHPATRADRSVETDLGAFARDPLTLRP